MKSSPQEWEPMHEHASVVKELESGQWSVQYIRDFVYTPDAPPQYRWSKQIIDISKITAAYFYVMPLEQFGKGNTLFAHTCVGFSFKDGTELLYSIEARQAAGQEYRPGNKTQNIRIFATLSYFKGFRHVVRKRGFFRYPLTLSQETLTRVLHSFLEDARDTYAQHDQYHPFTNQCTTALIGAMNRGLKIPIPRHPYWYLTRLTHRFLARQNIIDITKKEIL